MILNKSSTIFVFENGISLTRFKSLQKRQDQKEQNRILQDQ